jgi:hypothetical protein
VCLCFFIPSGLAELLVKDAISGILLNPLIWLYTAYKVQRELYMFLIQQFDNDPRLLKSLCRLPRVLDIIRQFYWDNAKSRIAIGSKPLLHPTTKLVIGERPSQEEIHKIRLLLLSLGEMGLRYSFFISAEHVLWSANMYLLSCFPLPVVVDNFHLFLVSFENVLALGGKN